MVAVVAVGVRVVMVRVMVVRVAGEDGAGRLAGKQITSGKEEAARTFFLYRGQRVYWAGKIYRKCCAQLWPAMRQPAQAPKRGRTSGHCDGTDSDRLTYGGGSRCEAGPF